LPAAEVTCKLLHVSWARWITPSVAAVTVLALGGGSQAAPAAEPGPRIVYAADGQILVMNGDGSRSRALASGRSPSWSPNGESIVFESARIPGNGLDLYVMDADGTNQRRLVNHPGGGGEHPVNTADDFAPAWSPAVWTIAFTTDRDGNDEIYTMDPIGHSVQRRTNMPSSERDPAWSPDGEVVAFVSDRDGNDDIFTLDRRQNLVPLTRDVHADRAPTWSPDGRQLAFQSFRDGNWEVYVMAADGTEQRRLTQSAAAETNPAWSPDGRTIVFTTSDGGSSYLARMSPSGGAAGRLTTQPADQADWQSADDLALTVSHPRRVHQGRRFRLRLAVRNKTAVDALDVIVTASLPAGLQLVRSRAAAGSCPRPARTTVSCWIPRLDGSGRAFVDVTLRPRRCGRMRLRQSVAGGQADLTRADNVRRTTLRVRCR
jgi:WD40-like Beta Propeller Repeat/Domain of unknown function DUF11